MSLRAIAFLAAAAFLVAPRFAVATHGEGDGPPNDFVTGAGHHSVPDTQFTISAHSGPLGEEPSGQLSFKIEGQERIHAEVTCLIVIANQAFATAVMTRPAEVEGQIVVMQAVDNDQLEVELPDLLRFSFAPAIQPGPTPECFLPVLPPVPVVQGNIVVHDAIVEPPEDPL